MEQSNSKEPLLSPKEQQEEEDDRQLINDSSQDYVVLQRSAISSHTASFVGISPFSSFVADSNDIPPINGLRDFYREFMVESKKLWYLAGPAILTSLCQYSLGAITQTLAGHVGTLDLAAFSVENSVIAGFSFGVMVYIYIYSYKFSFN